MISSIFSSERSYLEMIQMARSRRMAGITHTSQRMPCRASGVCVVASALKPTQARTRPGTTPPRAMPALKKMPVRAFTMPAMRLPVVYSP